MLGYDSASDVDSDVCVAEWVNGPNNKPFACSFLKPNPGRRDEMKYNFDVSKCDKLFDVLLQSNVIRLKEGHVIPPPEQLAKKSYCKWHNSFSHSTNECNYFRRQIQSALVDGRLSFGEGSKMKLDRDPFPINVIDFEGKKVLVRADQKESTKGKNVVFADEIKTKMIKPKSPEVDVWKVNERRKPQPVFKPTSEFLLNKYTSQQKRNVFQRLSGFKRARSPSENFSRNYGWQREHFNLASGPDCIRMIRGMSPSQLTTPVQRFQEMDRYWQRSSWLEHTRNSNARFSDAIILHDSENSQPRIQQRWVPRGSVRKVPDSCCLENSKEREYNVNLVKWQQGKHSWPNLNLHQNMSKV